jgi:hypothetical protein
MVPGDACHPSITAWPKMRGSEALWAALHAALRRACIELRAFTIIEHAQRGTMAQLACERGSVEGTQSSDGSHCRSRFSIDVRPCAYLVGHWRPAPVDLLS